MFSKSKISSSILYNVRHLPCYSYSIFRYRVFSVIEKENIRTMEMIHYHVKNGYLQDIYLKIVDIFFCWILKQYLICTHIRVSLVEQELPTLPEHLGSPLVFIGVRVTWSLVLYACFVDRCLSFCTFSFGHCVVCSSSLYGLWLPLWYLLAIVSSVLLRYMDYDYPFGICWPLCCSQSNCINKIIIK